MINGYGENATDCNGIGGAVGGIGNKDTGNDKSVLVAESVIYAENHGTISGKKSMPSITVLFPVLIL